MKTNKITVVPRLRFPEFRDGGDWEIKQVKDLLDYEQPTKYLVNNTNYINKGIPVLTANKSFILGYTNEQEGIYRNTPVIIFDDFTTDSKYVDFAFKVKSSAIKILSSKGANDIRFSHALFHTITFDASQHKRYYISTYQNISIKVPTLPEQQKIADCLSSLDDLINAENEQLDALQEYKAGLLQQLFPVEGETTPKLRFAEFKDDGDWEEVKLVDVAETSIGLVTTMTTSYVEKGIPLIRNSDIKPNAIRMTKLINLSKEFADKYENKKLLKNDIVTVHTGDIGVSAIVEQDLEGSLGFATLNTRVTSSNVSPEFVCWFFNSPEYKRFALSMATGDGRNNFNLRDFNKTILFIPDILEQQKIVDCLSSLDNLIQAKDEKIKTLKTHKQGLMQQLFPVMDGK